MVANRARPRIGRCLADCAAGFGRRAATARLVMLLVGLVAAPAAAQEVLSTRLLDGFDQPGAWSVVASDQVDAAIREVDVADDGSGRAGRALCLDYDFHGVPGHAGIRRPMPLDYPGNYRFDLRWRGHAPAIDLRFELAGAEGKDAWRVERQAMEAPSRWTPLQYKARHFTVAAGSVPDPDPRASDALALVVQSRAGGRGSVCFDELSISELAPADDGPLAATALSTAGDASASVDGDAGSIWRAPAIPGGQRLVLDLGRVREFGGLVLDWLPGAHASRYRVQLSPDGTAWQDVRDVAGGDGGRDWIALPEAEARYVALDLLEGPSAGFALAEATLRPTGFSSDPAAFVRAVAAELPRGRWPRAFSGEMAGWTLLGVDRGRQRGLLGGDGAVEVARGGFSIEPFVRSDGRLVTWADVSPRQSLQEGYLPLPSVDWQREDFSLRTTAFAAGTPERSQLVLRYRLANTSGRAREFDLALAVRPLQVAGTGVSRIERIAVDGGMVSVDGVPRVFAKQVPHASFATAFDAGDTVSHLAAGRLPSTTQVARDPAGLASAALVYRMRLGAGEVASVEVMVPMTGGSGPARRWWDAGELQREVAAGWRETLDRVQVDLPPQGLALADGLRTAVARMLVSQEWPVLQPGTRAPVDFDATAPDGAPRPALDLFVAARESDGSLLLAAGVPAEWLDHGVGVRGLPTPHGELGYRLRRDGGLLVLEVGEGLALPPGGLVLPWPWPGTPPGAATIDGRPAEWHDGELRIDTLPARVEIQAGGVDSG